MDYFGFKRAFEAKRSKLALPADCKELRVEVKFTSQYFWTVDWLLEFEDERYVRVREHYGKVAGLQVSQRRSFALHYGAIVDRAQDGTPNPDPQHPVDIRIDTCSSAAHMHFGAPEPHIPQSQIRKLQLATLDAFTFLQAILKHRATGIPLDKTLGFRIEGK